MWDDHGGDKVKVEIQFYLGAGFASGLKAILIARLAMLHLMREQAAPAHLGRPRAALRCWAAALART